MAITEGSPLGELSERILPGASEAQMSAIMRDAAKVSVRRPDFITEIGDSRANGYIIPTRRGGSNPIGLSGVDLLMISNGDGVSTNISDMTVGANSWAGPDETHMLTLLTDPFTIPQYTTKGYLNLTLNVNAFSAGSQFNVQILNMGIIRRLTSSIG